MSNKRNQYSTVIFDAILAASSDRIVEVIYRWLYKEYHEVSIHIESPAKSGTVTFLFIQLRLNDDGDQIGKPHQHAGSININGDTLGSHVVVSFFDWETADDRSDAYEFSIINDYATVPNQQKIFEQLVEALRREARVVQDNLMNNEKASNISFTTLKLKEKAPNLQFRKRAVIWRELRPWVLSLKTELTVKECIAEIKKHHGYKGKKISRQRMERILSEGTSGAYDEVLKNL